MTLLRCSLFAVAALAMLAAASGALSPLLSTALWLASMLALVCDPSGPIPRAVRRGLQLPVDVTPSTLREAEGHAARDLPAIHRHAA